MESGQVDGCCLLVAGGNASPLFQAVDAAFDRVALLVGLAVEGWWPATPAAASQTVAALIGRHGDDRPDAAPPEVFTDGPRRIRLVCEDCRWPGPGPSTPSGNAQPRHHVSEGRRVTGLSGGEMEGQGPAVAIGREMDLRGQSATGPADGVVVRLVGRGPLRAPAAC